MPISDNGVLKVSIIELLLPFGCIAIAIAFFTKRYVPSKIGLYLIYAIISFVAYYIILFAYRYSMGLEAKQSLLALRTTLPPLLLFLLADSKWLSYKRTVTDLVLINVIINAIQLTNIIELRLSPFLGNIMVFLSIIIALLPVNYYTIYKQNEIKYGRIFAVLSWFNIIIALVFPILSGSRIGFAASVLILLLSMLNHGIKKRAIIGKSIICVLLSVLLLGYLWNENPRGMSFGLYRLFPRHVTLVANAPVENTQPGNTPSAGAPTASAPVENQQPTQIDMQEQAKLANIDKVVKVMQQETEKSNVARSYLWHASISSIYRNPLLGEGVMYFEYPNDYNVPQQAAHNFILEHANAYGLIGLILYLLLLAIPVLGSLMEGSYNIFRNFSVVKGNMLISAAAVTIQSLFQPTMLIIATVMILWVSIGLWYSMIRDNKVLND